MSLKARENRTVQILKCMQDDCRAFLDLNYLHKQFEIYVRFVLDLEEAGKVAAPEKITHPSYTLD